MAFKKLWKAPTQTKVYYAWRAMRSRCLIPKNPSYHRYGGRGITVCDRWVNDFDAFLADMGEPPTPKHSLDRIDVNGNYEPSNCRWATTLEQSVNKASTELISHNGLSMTVTQWADYLGLERSRLWRRINVYKMPIERALTSGSLRPTMKHGTRGGYSHYGCRCDECRAFNTAEAAKYRKQRAQRNKEQQA
jgi:hypothetical protein